MEFLHSKGWYAPFQVRLRANRSWGKYVGLANLNTLLLVQLCDCSPSCRICLAWNHQLFLHPLFFLWKIPILSKSGEPIEATPTSPTWGLVRTQGFTEEEMDKMAVGDWENLGNRLGRCWICWLSQSISSWRAVYGIFQSKFWTSGRGAMQLLVLWISHLSMDRTHINSAALDSLRPNVANVLGQIWSNPISLLHAWFHPQFLSPKITLFCWC